MILICAVLLFIRALVHADAQSSLFDRHPLEHFATGFTAFRSVKDVEPTFDRVRRPAAAASCSQPRCGGHPLVIVPSLIGNQLNATLTNAQGEPHWWCSTNAPNYRLFIDVLDFVPYSPLQSCFWHNIGLVFNGTESVSPDGVRVDVPLELSATACLDADCKVPIWAGIIDMLATNLSYTPGVDVVSVNYDWRLGPDAMSSTFARTKAVIENVASQTGQPVVIVGLSMGSPHAALFLSLQTQSWRSKFVHGFVSLSGAFGGSLWATISQISSGLPIYANSTINGAQLFAAARGWSSLASLSPDIGMLGNVTQIVTPARNYTTSQFADLYADAGVPNGAAMIKVTMARQWHSYDRVNLGINVTCVFGRNVPAPSVVHFGDSTFGVPTQVDTAPGDGTLVDAALTTPCRAWKAKMVPVDGMRHGDVVRTPVALQALVDALF
jgi:pimeloyl-ACP methyl ester carboxylesterase